MDTKTLKDNDMATVKPNIQIDDEVREMTEEEYATYLRIKPDETPTAD